MRPLTTHRSTRAACGGDPVGAGAGDPLLPFARPSARRRGRLRGRGDAAGLLGRRREPARGEASGSRVGAGAGDGLALRRQRRGAHVHQPRGERARVRVRRQPVRAAAPAHARRRRVAVHGQRGRDRLHGRRARGGRGAGPRPVRPSDAGWFCGARRGGDPGARVCVDLSPDFPDGRARGWRCRTLHDGPARRVCERDAAAHTLAEACDPGHPCVDGSRCAEGWCVPERPAPGCWLQTDCPGGRCRFGSCIAGGA